MEGEGESEKKESERRERERDILYMPTHIFHKYIPTYIHTYTLVMSSTSKGSETNEASIMGKLGISKRNKQSLARTHQD